MGKNALFDKNLLALSEKNQKLSERVRRAEAPCATYTFLESRQGDKIPALVDPAGSARPLHSMVDPRKEATRLISTVETESFLVLLGLGGGYYVEAALERDDIGVVLVVEYDLSGLAELFSEIDYTRFFRDARFHLLADACESELRENILDLYQPALYGGIRVIPTRSRTVNEPNFIMATDAIQAAITRVSADFSVQAHFGKRWFSNIVRNLKSAETARDDTPEIRRAAVTAAGSSLSAQIPALRQKRDELFLIATDTSLPCLLHEKLTPDAVITIDCQHISYHHFMAGFPDNTLLFLDLASPPGFTRLTKNYRFFATDHPLTRYISRTWKDLPSLDVSGGNVTYAAISLAEQLGAREIELYGADFACPNGVPYARGAYTYSVFAKKQSRLSPLETQASAFLYRVPLSKVRRSDDSWYYETETLKFYREGLEEKSERMDAVIIPQPGFGAPMNVKKSISINTRDSSRNKFERHSKPSMTAKKFLEFYRDKIANLPKPGKNAAEYLASLREEDRALLATILPAAAALKQGSLNFAETLEATKAYCVSRIKALP